MPFKLKYKPFGNEAILIEWPKKINDSILKDIINFKQSIEEDKNFNTEDLISGYNSLTIKYSFAIRSFEKTVKKLETTYLKLANAKTTKTTFTWHIPVCYDTEHGLDLQELATVKQSSINEIIKLHTNTIYKVYFIGFLPGFLYLGGLNAKLHCNRKATPRLNITKGSVGIGGSQTGIYPNNSAGGWNIIGKTPVSFFNASKNNPCFAKAGDCIKFVAITKAEFLKIEHDIASGTFHLKSEING